MHLAFSPDMPVHAAKDMAKKRVLRPVEAGEHTPQLAFGCVPAEERVVEVVLLDQGVADGALLDEELVVGQNAQHIVEASPPQLRPIVVSGRQYAVAFGDAVAARCEGAAAFRCSGTAAAALAAA